MPFNIQENNVQTLKSLCELVVDCPHSTPKWTDSGVIVLRNQNIKNGKLDLSNPSYTDENHYLGRIKRAAPQEGDIVITREAPMGDVCQIPANLKCCLGQRQVLLRPNSDKVDGRYLFYALQSEYLQHQIGWNEGTGSTVSNLRIPVLESLNVPTPSIAKQREISSTLGSVDDSVNLLSGINSTLESIAQALFKSWFIDFDPVKAKMAGRQPEAMDETTTALFPAEFEESTVGLKPKGWQVKRIDDLMELVYGKALKATNRLPGGVPVYGSGGITGFHNEHLVSGPSVIVGRKGTVGSLYWEDRPFFPIDTVFYIKPKTVPLTFCYELLKTKGLNHMNTDAAVPGLNRDNVYRLESAVPTANILNAFDDIVLSIRKMMFANSQEAQRLTEIRDALLPKLMSGQLRIPETQFIMNEIAA